MIVIFWFWWTIISGPGIVPLAVINFRVMFHPSAVMTLFTSTSSPELTLKTFLFCVYNRPFSLSIIVNELSMINDVTQCGTFSSHLKHTDICIIWSMKRKQVKKTSWNEKKRKWYNERCTKKLVIKNNENSF